MAFFDILKNDRFVHSQRSLHDFLGDDTTPYLIFVHSTESNHHNDDGFLTRESTSQRSPDRFKCTERVKGEKCALIGVFLVMIGLLDPLLFEQKDSARVVCLLNLTYS